MTRALQNHGRPGCLLMAVLLTLLALGDCRLAFALEPREDVLRERISCIELNRYYSQTDDGEWVETKLTFEQFVFLDFDPVLGQHIVEAWRMRKNNETPRFNHDKGVWQLWFKDGSVLRCIEAKTFRERDSLYDFELDQRQGVQPHQRRELRSPGR